MSELPVKVGLPLGTLQPRAWLEVTEEADRLGFESVWIPEHLVLPVNLEGSPVAGSDHPPIPPEVPVFDVFAYLAFLAGRTRRIRFGTHVFNIGLRHPFATARAVATLDVLSEGRAEFGVGASWLRAEWDAVGLDFDSRGRRVDEALCVCRRLWSEQVIEHHGEFFDFAPVAFEPKPVQQPAPPLHIGGDGAAALRRAATIGDGWIPMNHTLDQIPAAATRLRELREAAGRDGLTEITLGAAVEGPDDLERYAEAGVGRVLVSPWRSVGSRYAGRSGGGPNPNAVDAIRRFADDVLPGRAAQA